MAPKGLSLHIGLNSVDPAHYNGWHGTLNACEFDANDMEAIAKAQGFTTTKLLTKQATRDQVLGCIQAAARELKLGDIFLLTYSGHGGQVTDVQGDEADRYDETWCLYDSQLIDDELYYELCCFQEGVRILVLSDSCFSGTITRAAPGPVRVAYEPDAQPKMLPLMLALKVYSAHKEFYDEKQRVVREKLAKMAQKDLGDYLLSPRAVTSQRMRMVVKGMKAATILISGSQENQTSQDGQYNGLFTEKLLLAWDSGLFRGNHVQFHSKILALMPLDAQGNPYQTPNLFFLGPAAEFAKQRPFTI